MRRSKELILSVILGLAWPALARGQSGTIAGILVDGDTGETLVGASAIIEGTDTGDASDINGAFSFEAAVGTYTVVFSYLGYNRVTINGVQVSEGEVTHLEITLSPDAIEIGEVVVEAALLLDNEAGLLRGRSRAIAVSDAISAQAISRSGSGDAAAAMTKVTGASVVAGRYVYIRGLGDRYASTTLNGSALPSADPDRKAFQLDLFPAALLENIVTLKTFTPDKPGDFSGGLIDVATKALPESFTLQVSSTLTYDELSSGIDNFLSYPGGGSDWRGRDDGSRALPYILQDKAPEEDMPREHDLRDIRLGVTNEIRTARADSLNAFARAFNSVMSPSQKSVPASYSFSAAVGGRNRVLGRPLGITGSLTYDRSYTYYDDGVFSKWQLTGGDVAGVDNLTSDTYFGPDPDLELISRADPLEAGSFANMRGSDEVHWGASGTIAYQPADTHELAFTALRTQSGIQEATLLGGFRDQNSTATFFTRSLDYEQRALSSYQVRGEHVFRPLIVEWKGSRSSNTQAEPDLRFFSSVQNIQVTPAGIDTTYSLGGGNAPPPQRYFRDLSEDNLGGVLDVSLTFRQWTGLGAKFKVGGLYEDGDRSFRQRRFEYDEGREIRFRDFGGDAESFFNPDNLGVLDTLIVGDIVAYNAGLYILENSPKRANYDATRSVRAGYAMLELPLSPWMKVVGGVRMESTRMTTESLDESLPEEQRLGILDQTDILPSVNLVFTLRENMNLRAAATRTLARPTFRELAPFQSFNFVGGDIQEGNPLLDRTLITNLDSRWEWLLRPGEILAASAFYKRLDQPIERVLRTVGEGRFISFQNVERGAVYGLELEARKRLNAISDNPALRRLSIGGNFSLVKSAVDIPEAEMVNILASDPGASPTRRLDGQSPYLLNLNASYENHDSGTTASLFYHVFGDRLLVVTEGATPDVFEKSRADLDLTLTQDLPANFRVKGTLKNILGTDLRQIQTFKDRIYDYISYSRARTFSLGLSYLID